MQPMVPSQGTMIASSDVKLYKSLAPLIRDYREWRNLSQETFAESIGVSVRELRYWEADRRCARIDNLHDLSEFTGIPMQVCIALNADQPVWYSLRKRLFAFSSVEVQTLFSNEFFKYSEQSDESILIRDQISTDSHINAILTWHRDISGTRELIRRDVIKAASMILPDLNRITFDCWGHFVGYCVCLPIKLDTYHQIKKEKHLESYLTTEMIRDILALHEGVFCYYSSFAVNGTAAHRQYVENVRYFAKIKQKRRYLLSVYAATKEMEIVCNHFGMKVGFAITRQCEDKHADFLPTVYEIGLDLLSKRWLGSGFLRRPIKGYDGRVCTANLNESVKREGLAVTSTQKPNNDSRLDDKYLLRGKLGYSSLSKDMLLNVDGMLLNVDGQKQGNGKAPKNQISNTTATKKVDK